MTWRERVEFWKRLLLGRCANCGAKAELRIRLRMPNNRFVTRRACRPCAKQLDEIMMAAGVPRVGGAKP